MSMKKIALVILIIITAASFAFSGGNRQSSGRTQLTFSAWLSGAERVMADALIEEFMRANPDLEVEANIAGDYLARMNAMIAAGATPDVFQASESLINEMKIMILA